MADNEERVPEDMERPSWLVDDVGDLDWEKSLGWIRAACVALRSAQQELVAAGCHKRAKANARQREARQIHQALLPVDKDVAALETIFSCTRDSSVLFRVIAVSLSNEGPDASVPDLAKDPVSDRVLVADQAIMMSAAFVQRRAEAVRQRVSTFTASLPGSDVDMLAEAVMLSLHELRLCTITSTHLIDEFHHALRDWRAAKHMDELTLGCISTPHGIN